MPLQSSIQQQVFDLLSKASDLSFVSAEKEAGTLLGLFPGQRVNAEVLTTLPNNRTQVQIGANRFNLELPMAVRQGQTLEMTFVSREPRATFAIARQGGNPPPVSLSDASRLLSLLISSEQNVNPELRSSLQSIGELLRRSTGEAGVLANLMDEALTYERGATPIELPGAGMPQPREGAAFQKGTALPAGHAPLSSFETNASQILQHIARNSRFILTEAVSQPMTPLPLSPGEEVDAAVIGTLPGGRVFVQIAGVSLELLIPRDANTGDILRLTFISPQPKPLFALSRASEGVPSALSETGRWLSMLEHSGGGVSEQQLYVLGRLNSILESLPPDSPAFSAIQDEPITYQSVIYRKPSGESSSMPGAATVIAQHNALQSGNGVVLSDDMAKLLQALIKGNRLALLEAINQQASSPGFMPGQQIKGEVLATLGGGRFLVQVADQSFEFSLPKGTSRGDRINLFFITNEPQTTFLMARFGRTGEARVSETGKWLSSFLGTATELVPAQETLGILKALLTEPPGDASQVSLVLQQGLRDSGLFYESHLARWFGGDYHLEDILREPQGKLSNLRQPIEVGANPAEKSAGSGMKGSSVEVMEAMLKKAGANLNEGMADHHALPIVREQLSTLQSGQIIFRGDLVPGQPMEWRVREREGRRNSAGKKERAWETLLSLDLPKLGNINVKLKLQGTRVNLELQTANPVSTELLHQDRKRLDEQLEAAGLVSSEITIRHENA